ILDFDATADCRDAQQRTCDSHVMKQTRKGACYLGVCCSASHRLSNRVIDDCLREVLSLYVERHGIESWGRTSTVVGRRRSVTSRWLSSSPIDPRPSAGESSEVERSPCHETKDRQANSHSGNPQRGSIDRGS